MQDVLGYEGRHVVVTGAASGMGAAAAQILVDVGAEVTAIDIKPTSVAVKTSLEVDLRDKVAIDKAVEAIPGSVDAIASCAGLPGPPFSDLDVMLVNLVGARHLIESLVPRMTEGSAIATIASTAGLGWQDRLPVLMELIASNGFDGGKQWCESHPDDIAPSAYATSKQAMNAWVSWRSFSLIGDGIRLNTLNPGPTETPMMPAFESIVGGADVMDSFTEPINRRSTPEEQAWPLVVLNSPRMSYVNGHLMFADGGFLAGLMTGQIAPPMVGAPPE